MRHSFTSQLHSSILKTSTFKAALTVRLEMLAVNKCGNINKDWSAFLSANQLKDGSKKQGALSTHTCTHYSIMSSGVMQRSFRCFIHGVSEQNSLNIPSKPG